MEALQLGFSSVMYDCSTASYEENLEKVAEMEGYRSVSTGIYASEFGRTYYIRVRTPAGVGRVLEYSVETYVARNLNAELDDSARRMVIAMMEYGDAVSAYRASLLD